MKPFETRQAKLTSRSALIGIVGMGYVGLPVSLRLAELKLKVIDFDIDLVKTEKLNREQSYIRHFSNEQIQLAIERRFEATTGNCLGYGYFCRGCNY